MNYRPFHLPAFALALLLAACQSLDTTKIVQPTDYQLSTVSLSLPREVIATNMAAQSLEENDTYTLVGAALQRGEQQLVGLWLFSKQDSSFIKSINQTALTYSPFPRLEKFTPTQEADNLLAFLSR